MTVVVNDGAATSASNTSTISVAAVNDAPTATITPASYNATEQTNLTLHGTGLSIADVDAGGNDVTVTLSVTQGILTIAAGNSGVNSVSGSGTSSALSPARLRRSTTFSAESTPVPGPQAPSSTTPTSTILRAARR